MFYTTPRVNPHSLIGYSWDQITTQFQGNKRNQAMALWQWSTVRFSSNGTDQARYFNRYGAAATYARINKVRAWLELPLI